MTASSVPRALVASRSPPTADGLTLETMGAHWWSALDAAETAVRDAGAWLAPAELHELNARLANERAFTVELLDEVAHDEGLPLTFDYVLVSRSSLRTVLGLPSAVSACVFNLDGVLIASAALHAAAWAETLDEFIAARVERTGGRFAPFDARTDYREHFHGKPRLDGLRGFLAIRGVALPEGEATDPPDTETVHGLANRKKLALMRRLDEQGVRAFEGSRRYLEAARDAGLGRAGVSASTNTDRIVELAGLSSLIEQSVDGNVIVAHHLRPRPAPDILVAACDVLHVAPSEAAAFETSAVGVQAARAAGFRIVVGVVPDAHAKPLLDAGADVVVTGLAEILERNLHVRH